MLAAEAAENYRAVKEKYPWPFKKTSELHTEEIAIARIAGALVALGMKTSEMVTFAEWLRKTFDDNDLATDALNGEDIALKIAPGDEPGPLVSELEKPSMNGVGTSVASRRILQMGRPNLIHSDWSSLTRGCQARNAAEDACKGSKTSLIPCHISR
jgi:hypothetical protein